MDALYPTEREQIGLFVAAFVALAIDQGLSLHDALDLVTLGYQHINSEACLDAKDPAPAEARPCL